MSSELFHRSIAELKVALDARKLSAVELIQAIVARTKAVEPRVRAFNLVTTAVS